MKKVFIIHGWTYTLNAWDALLAELRTSNIEPVMLNVPGLTSASHDVWTLDKYVEWLKQQLENHSDVTLIGHSNGGRIAIAFAAKYPEHLSRLILIDAAGIVHREMLLELKREVFKVLAKVGRIFTSSSFIRKIFYRLIGAHDYERAPANMRETMKNLIERDLTPELSLITTPTLIIWGEKDSATPITDANVMHSKISRSRLTTIPNAKHSPYATHPKEVRIEITRWIST